MHSFGFKVVPLEDGDAGVPVAVAGQSMVDIQKLLTDIGGIMVRLELRIQNDIPEQLLRKFDLNIGGSSGSGLGTDPSKGSEEIMERALDTLCATLDFLGTGAVGTWLEDNYPEPIGRKVVAQDMVALSDPLDGYKLIYGPKERQREFKGINREKIEQYAEAETDTVEGGIVGVILKDPVRRNRWMIANDDQPVQISFGSNISLSDVPSFAQAGPIIATGEIIRKDGKVTEVRNVHGCYSFPEVKFHRIMTPDKDIFLLNPSIARPGYTESRGLWTLTCDELGIDVAKPSWDECVLAYHEYFAFLWETYYESGDEFEGEEAEVRDFLASLAPVI